MRNPDHIPSPFESSEPPTQTAPQRVAKVLRPYFAKIARVIECIDIDAPLTLSFCFSCIIIQIFNYFIGNMFIISYFSVPSWNLFNVRHPFSYIRMIMQTMGHLNWNHLNGNIVNLLLVGPSCEREFGMASMLKVMILTAIVSSLTHIVFSPDNMVQLGASGVVFTLILLNSLVEVQLGRIPLTFLCQVVLWCYKELADYLSTDDHSVSHLAHISGAVVGTVAGYYLHDRKINTRVKKMQRYFRASRFDLLQFFNCILITFQHLSLSSFHLLSCLATPFLAACRFILFYLHINERMLYLYVRNNHRCVL
jgi:membrane associated rhomboid family serine protease